MIAAMNWPNALVTVALIMAVAMVLVVMIGAPFWRRPQPIGGLPRLKAIEEDLALIRSDLAEIKESLAELDRLFKSVG